MTLFASSPEISAMRVVACMATVACFGRGNLAHVFLPMARSACQAFVPTCQGEIRLFAMIEAPSVPGVRRVAGGTVSAKASLVMFVAMAA
jgi:hypothetical protein